MDDVGKTLEVLHSKIDGIEWCKISVKNKECKSISIPQYHLTYKEGDYTKGYFHAPSVQYLKNWFDKEFNTKSEWV